MKKKFIIAGIVALIVGSVFGREHPFLFMTPSDIERVQQNARFDKEFENLAQEQIARARKVDVNQLPPFETDWWAEEEAKSYLGADRAVTLEHMRLVPQKYSTAAKDCARAWILTGETRFLDKAKAILLKQSEYDFGFEDVNCGLDYSVASLGAMEAYDIAYDRFTAPEHAKMKDFFVRLVAAVKQNDDYWVANNPSGAPLNNHEGWHRACMAMVGFFYDIPEYVDLAISGPKGFEDMLRYGFQDDGLWVEGSLPYSYVQLEAMLFIAELAYNAGYPVNLYEYAIDDGVSLKKCYDTVFDLVFPDGLLPPVGDGYGSLHYPGSRKYYERLYTRLGDRRHAWLINHVGKRDREALFWGVADLSVGEPPAASSKLWFRHGYAALRASGGTNYWNGNCGTLFANFSSNPCHSHADKLSIMLYAKGHLWLRDSECKPGRVEKFSSDVNKNLNWTTPSHNTVLIDFKNQARTPPAPLDLVEYTILPDAKRITMGDSTSLLYPGVRQLRTCIVCDDYVIDVFQIKADQPHDISWATHVDAEAVDCFKSDFKSFNLPEDGPWRFIEANDISGFGEVFWETFYHEGKHFRMDVFSGYPAQYARCSYPLTEGKSPQYIPMRLVTCHGSEAFFAAVYRVGDEAMACPVEFKVNEVMADSWQLDIQYDEKLFKHRIPRLKDLSVGTN